MNDSNKTISTTFSIICLVIFIVVAITSTIVMFQCNKNAPIPTIVIGE